MSAPHEPLPAKLVVGLLFRDFDVRSEALQALTTRFGPLDYLSEPKIFEYTLYYEKEMGPGLYRQVGSFLRLAPVETLPDIKVFTNDLERRFLQGDRRRINIDPGLLSEERLILATGKNFTHRIYLRDGIYADLTLIYQKGAYRTLPWTYPDYGAPSTRQVLGVLRQKLIYQRTGRIPTKDARPRGDSY
jgi:hypothetical protein